MRSPAGRFLQLPTLLTAVLLTVCSFVHVATAQETDPSASAAGASGSSIVYFALAPSVFREGQVQPAVVRRMVDSLVLAVTGRSSVASAWGSLVQPQDRVGIKVAATGQAVSGTHPAVVQAVVDGLRSAGVPAEQILVWDRRRADMRAAGYDRLTGCRVLSTDRDGGYDPEAVVTGAVLGTLIHGDLHFVAARDAEGGGQTSSESHISRILTGKVDKVIHLPALTDSVHTGVAGAFSGMTLDNLDNWRRFGRAPHFGDPYLVELYADPRLTGKVVLTLLDALRPQYAGGPFPEAQYTIPYGALFVSRDPVALDATGLRLLDEYRTRAKLPPIAEVAHWPLSAAYLGLGRAEEKDIRLIRIGPAGKKPPP